MSTLLALALAAPAAHALPLVTERFDGAELGAGWKIAAAKGGGPAATWAVEGGALVGRAEAKTKRFPTVYRRVELWDVAWIKVDVRRKAENVSAPACDVFVRFDGHPVEPARPCAAAADWTATTRYFAVPAGVREVEVGFQLTGAGTVSFDDFLVEPVKPDVKELSRGHFDYRWFGTDALREEELAANDEAYDKVVAFLGLTKTVDIEYWKHANLDAVEQHTGVRKDAVVQGSTVHTLWRGHTAAIASILARAWGDPPPLLVEGLGVHLAGDWDGKAVKQLARGMVGRGEAPTLGALLDDQGFRALPPGTSYPMAGAFVEWVVATKGQAGLQALYGQLKAGADNRKALESGLGMPLAEADKAFRAWL